MTLGEMVGLCIVIAMAAVTAIELPMDIVRSRNARRAEAIEKRKARNRKIIAADWVCDGESKRQIGY